MTEHSDGFRLRLFIGLCAVGAIVVVGLLWSHRRPATQNADIELPLSAPLGSGDVGSNDFSVPVKDGDDGVVASTIEIHSEASALVEETATPRQNRRLFHRYTGLDGNYGKLAYQVGNERRYVETLSCDVAYVAGGRGICLMAKRGVITTYSAGLFDATSFSTDVEFSLDGMPSRSRVSRDGRLAAYTVFLTGHGYSSVDFSTQTMLLEARTGRKIADLESDFTVLQDGKVIKEQDFNFWGVTFTPDALGFYATLSTGQKHFLVRGDIAARTMTVLHENVECPSLSPDGTRVAYKKRLMEGTRVLWQLQVLDLATMKETVIGERRSIDDQLEWLDDASVLYSVPRPDQDTGGGTDVWVALADGSGTPRLLIENAYSPAVGG